MIYTHTALDDLGLCQRNGGGCCRRGDCAQTGGDHSQTGGTDQAACRRFELTAKLKYSAQPLRKQRLQAAELARKAVSEVLNEGVSDL